MGMSRPRVQISLARQPDMRPGTNGASLGRYYKQLLITANFKIYSDPEGSSDFQVTFCYTVIFDFDLDLEKVESRSLCLDPGPSLESPALPGRVQLALSPEMRGLTSLGDIKTNEKYYLSVTGCGLSLHASPTCGRELAFDTPACWLAVPV
ncbi:hypothetical protein RRG08_010813 [Elysia crispata]|uniref:Uncharacterized protein n=1 Tax=Elysia crispata TaxID=231223 RepID=A0AAE0ZEU0_9GAST|nr:hypothetical protein RRG08_010813 [Elysia crispata]